MKSIKLDHITLGVCYYPEHWECSMWLDDLRRMKEMGIETVRVAEFAWNKFEPVEGEFTFEFFDKFMDLAYAEGIKVIFCTPTATPPAWMSERYPEILNADKNGNLIHHGFRRHPNLNSEKFRFFSARITEKIAEHYSRYPNIVGWQLDNEINCECSVYYSESDHKAFREYLKRRFGTLERFNEVVGAVFWNQTYTDWEEIHLLRNTYNNRRNPHMGLIEKQFISDTVIGYFKLQADIIRKYSNAYITTNGLFDFIDYEYLTDEIIDFISFDNYPNFRYAQNLNPANTNGMRDRNTSHKLTRVRGISPIFAIMEQQSGAGGGTNGFSPQATPKPGQMRLWTMQTIAHGADYVSYFRWRTCPVGTEMYWNGIFNCDNRFGRRAEEVMKTHRDIGKIQAVCGEEYFAEIALLWDCDNEWDAAEDTFHSGFDRWSQDSWFRVCQKKHIPYDLIYINERTTLESLSKYKLVVYLHPAILTERAAELLRSYAEQGGTVIFGCRTGYKDTTGRCLMTPPPGYAADFCGAKVEDFTFLSAYDAKQYINIGEHRMTAYHFNDILEVIDGEAIGTYENNYYAGRCGASLKRIGKGRVYYYGAVFGAEAVEVFLSLENMGVPRGIGEWLDIPETVELAVRGNYAFLLNYEPEPVEIKTKKPCRDMISDAEFTDGIKLEPYGVAVLEI